MTKALCTYIVGMGIVSVGTTLGEDLPSSEVDRGRYLATIGVCAACHTPPDVPLTAQKSPTPEETALERKYKTDPDWFRYLDPEGKHHFAGGVPFILRFPGGNGNPPSHGVVYSRNITPHEETGIGKWSTTDIVTALRTGKRPDGSSLFRFPPHTFYKNLSNDDVHALAAYLKALPPIDNKILPRSLPFEPSPVAESDLTCIPSSPMGRTTDRARYLMSALVGCRECHSHKDSKGVFRDFQGGAPGDPFEGVFRLGPDLPLRQSEKGFAAFPYPGYAVLYGGNLTRFGLGGDRSHHSSISIVNAIRKGVSVDKDAYGREKPLAHVMMWQFYTAMNDDDAFAIAEYLKSLQYVPNNKVTERLLFFGDDWKAAFLTVFGEEPTAADATAFGH